MTEINDLSEFIITIFRVKKVRGKDVKDYLMRQKIEAKNRRQANNYAYFIVQAYPRDAEVEVT